MADKWRRVAEKLAQQLVAHAFCETHPASGRGKDCPFCADVMAYQAYLAAGGRDFRDPPYTGPVVSIAELHAHPEKYPMRRIPPRST